MPTFAHNGLSFQFLEKGKGLPFVYQHGLGGDVSQPFALYSPPENIRLLGFDARAHGETRPFGDIHKVALRPFAEDLVAFLDHLKIDRAIVGGISMGAAVALTTALRFPDRVQGLVVTLPATIDRPIPENARIFPHIAQFLLKYGVTEGLARFRETAEYHALEQADAESARSIEHQFTQPRALECVIRLECIPHDCPCHEREELAAINVPTLVIGSRHDPFHPFEFAQTIARIIPKATLAELTPKSWSFPRHLNDMQAAIDDFLNMF